MVVYNLTGAVAMLVGRFWMIIPAMAIAHLTVAGFVEFALTLAVAIAVSAVLSLTLTAMMCAWILKPEPPAEQRIGDDAERLPLPRGQVMATAKPKTLVALTAFACEVKGVEHIIRLPAHRGLAQAFAACL